ncbi:MAG: hypothetical protein PHG00_14055 [Methylococcales bacterium]|nr:hypothetical protein [Methylococcales bacterium]
MSHNRYTIHDFHILDAEANPIPKIYIRELLDSSSAEFLFSKLNSRQKIDVIEALGIEELTVLLHNCYQYTGKTYNAEQEAEFTWMSLRNVSQ